MKLPYTYLLTVDGEKIQTIKYPVFLTDDGKETALRQLADDHNRPSTKGMELHRVCAYDNEPIHKFSGLLNDEKCVS